MTAKSFGRIAAEHATVRIAYMSEITRGRIRAVGAGLCVCATLASGGSSFLAANDAPIRLLGVRAQGSAIVIEASAPVAFAVSNPDAWTVQLDLRDVSVDGAANQVTRTDTVARVSLEQASAVDGREVARVRLSLARPASYKVRSARSTIRVELADAPAAMPVPPPSSLRPHQNQFYRRRNLYPLHHHLSPSHRHRHRHHHLSPWHRYPVSMSQRRLSRRERRRCSTG